MTASLSDSVSPPVTAARFIIACEGWTTGLGFSELAGFTSEVELTEYSYTGMIGNVHTKQFGRARPPSVSLKRALDAAGFGQLFGWHMLARMNDPMAKSTAAFTIMAASGTPALSCMLENAWCSRLEIDPAQAGASSAVMMKATIVCDSILLA